MAAWPLSRRAEILKTSLRTEMGWSRNARLSFLKTWSIGSQRMDIKKIPEAPMTAAFEEYMDSELALAKEVEQLVLRRRSLQGFDDRELAHFTETEGIWGLMLDHTPEVDKRLESAKREIRDLQLRINRMLDSPVERRLHKKEQDSILIVLA